jgi:hypothetical protein
MARSVMRKMSAAHTYFISFFNLYARLLCVRPAWVLFTTASRKYSLWPASLGALGFFILEALALLRAPLNMDYMNIYGGVKSAVIK